MIHQEILLSEFWLQIERRFDPRRRFKGQMPDVKGICQEGCYMSLHYGLSFQKTKITKQKKLLEDFTGFSFFTILICPQSKIILFFIFVKKYYYFHKGLSKYGV